MYFTMILRLFLLICTVTTVLTIDKTRRCLMGYMTDVQSWVDANGDLTANVEADVAIDLSKQFDFFRISCINFESHITGAGKQNIKYLSLAKCKLGRVPKIFHFKSFQGELSETLEYLTLYGNNFVEVSSTGDDYQMSINATQRREVGGVSLLGESSSIWAMGFEDITFTNLKELDLRSCGIKAIGKNVFKGMKKLEALYLGENNLYEIGTVDFVPLRNLIHLDISRNGITKNQLNSLIVRDKAFFRLRNLRSLDMSFTLLHPRSTTVFSELGRNVKKLSLCWTGLQQLTEGFFKQTPLRQLDVSGNLQILQNPKALKGLENSLETLYATDVKLKEFDVFKNLRSLEILNLTNNELVRIKRGIATTLKSLQILDLDNNRFATWLHPTFYGMHTLRLLSMTKNNINVLSVEMTEDIKNISYIGLSGNLIVCNCHTRELLESAALNEMVENPPLITLSSNETNDPNNVKYNRALVEYNNMIRHRLNISFICNNKYNCNTEETKYRGKFLLLDYDTNGYSCLEAFESKLKPFMEVKNCYMKSELNGIESDLQRGLNLLLLLIIPGILLPTLLAMFIFRRRIRYFLISMRNSATLSLISSNEVMDDTKIYNYDVFVSYCHEDRAWMLDQLLPHLETDCSVSVCLHERDFQVGLSILENIVSCMDRSRTIMLIISKQFLMSQWCQFEMHLAQHRLLETRREDLTLILLEDIPRKLRPNTLHYLMLTKTYIVWPKEESDQALFWRRLKKSVVTQKNKLHDNVTLA